MTRPQKLKSFVYFIFFIASVLLYVMTVNEVDTIAKKATTENQNVALKSENTQSTISNTSNLNY